MNSKQLKEYDYLKKSILEDKKSYEEIGREYNYSGANIKKVARLIGIELPQKRVINPNETFNRKVYICINCGKEFNRKIASSNKYRDNLRMICPNCDSQLDTYKSKNKCGERSYYRYHKNRSASEETPNVELP